MKIFHFLIISLFATFTKCLRIDLNECGKNKGCFKWPTSCESELSCKKIVTWKNEKEDIEFEMMGRNNYFAIGFSFDRRMANTSILACVKYNERVFVEQYYAKDNKGIKKKSFIGIKIKQVKNIGGMIYCKFTRAKEYTNDEEIFNLTSGNEYYLLTASGLTNSQELKNHYDDKTASYFTYDFTKVSPSLEEREINLNECDRTKRCFKQPFSCNNELTCDKIITWKNHLDTVEFEIFGKKEFIALAFSRDMMMKDSSIIACAKRKGHAEIQLYFAYGNSYWDVEFKNLKGIEVIRKDVESDFIRCKFRRMKSFPNDQDLFDISLGNQYHLLVAAGHLGLDGKLGGHETDRLATFVKYDFSEELSTVNQTTIVHPDITTGLYVPTTRLEENRTIPSSAGISNNPPFSVGSTISSSSSSACVCSTSSQIDSTLKSSLSPSKTTPAITPETNEPETGKPGIAINLSDCYRNKGCIKRPINCRDEASCKKIVTWKDRNDVIDFEIMGKKDYMAIGFSYNRKMANTSIISCTKLRDGRVDVQMYFATGNGPNSVKRKKNDGIIIRSLENENSQIRCRFSKRKISNDPEIFDLKPGNYYYILMAAGPSLNDIIQDHKYDKTSSLYPIDLTRDKGTSGTITLNKNNFKLFSMIFFSFISKII